jgi:hypothetical protein
VNDENIKTMKETGVQMKLKENELKIFYSGGLNQDLDNAIEKLLGAFGYERWASGMDKDDVRDLAFDRYGHNIIDSEGDRVFRMEPDKKEGA